MNNSTISLKSTTLLLLTQIFFQINKLIGPMSECLLMLYKLFYELLFETGPDVF